MGSQVHCGGMWENTELEKRQECLCSQLATMCSKQSSSPGANSFRTSLKAESYLRGTWGRLSSPCSGRGSALLTPSYTADVKGQRPWNACLWDSSLFRTPQRELSVRCSRRKKKKWSSSWGLDYFTWKNEASFLPASLYQWDRTQGPPGWLCPLPHLGPETLRISCIADDCRLCSSLLHLCSTALIARAAT